MSASGVGWSHHVPPQCLALRPSSPTLGPGQDAATQSQVTPHSGPIHSHPMTLTGLWLHSHVHLYSQTHFPFCSFSTTHKLISIFGFIIPFPAARFSVSKGRPHEETSRAPGPWRTEGIWSCENRYEGRRRSCRSVMSQEEREQPGIRSSHSAEAQGE